MFVPGRISLRTRVKKECRVCGSHTSSLSPHARPPPQGAAPKGTRVRGLAGHLSLSLSSSSSSSSFSQRRCLPERRHQPRFSLSLSLNSSSSSSSSPHQGSNCAAKDVGRGAAWSGSANRTQQIQSGKQPPKIDRALGANPSPWRPATCD